MILRVISFFFRIFDIAPLAAAAVRGRDPCWWQSASGRWRTARQE